MNNPHAISRLVELSQKCSSKEFDAPGAAASYLVGTGGVAAYRAPYGKKIEAYGEGYKHDAVHGLKGAAIGAGAGAATGAGLIAAHSGARKHVVNLIGRAAAGTRGSKISKIYGYPALAGGYLGASIGAPVGVIAGIHSAKGHEIRNRHTNLAALDRLTELSRKIELGLFNPTKQVASYDPHGNYTGNKTAINPVGVAADATAVGAAGVGGVLAHNAIMGKFGTESGMASDAYGNAARSAANKITGAAPTVAKEGGFVMHNPATGSKVAGPGLIASGAVAEDAAKVGSKFGSVIDKIRGLGKFTKAVV